MEGFIARAVSLINSKHFSRGRDNNKNNQWRRWVKARLSCWDPIWYIWKHAKISMDCGKYFCEYYYNWKGAQICGGG